MKRYYSDYDRDDAYGESSREPEDYEAYPQSGYTDDARGNNASAGVRTKKKKTSKKLKSVLSLFIIVAVFVVVIVFFFVSNADAVVSMTETPITADMTKLDIGSGMLYQDGDTLNYYDWTKSNRNYSEKMKVSNLRMTGSDSLAVVYTDTVIQFVDSKIQRELNGTILSVECGESHIAVLWRSSSGKDSIVILDKNLEQVDQLLADEAYIINFGFYSHDGEMLWMQSLSLTASTPVTRITTYDLNKSASTGVVQIQDQLIDSFYFTENSIFAVGINQIIRFTYDNQEMYREMIYGYKVIDFSDGSDSPTFLLAPREGDMNAIRLLTVEEEDDSGATDTHLQLPGEGIAGYIMDGSLVVLTENTAYTYSLLGKLTQEASLDRPATAAEKISDSMLLILSDGVYYTAKIS